MNSFHRYIFFAAVGTKSMYHFQGLVLSKQRSPLESPNDSSLTQEKCSLSTSSELKSGCVPKAHEETCPVCQEKLSNQKMVFQCGHVTCCKCKSSSLVRIALFVVWPQKSREH